MNQNIYRIIKPYQSNKVYSAQTTLHGAGKCYNELKKNNVKCNSFTIMNINNNSIYDFNINKKPEMILKDSQSVIQNELLSKDLSNQNGGFDIKRLENELKNQIKLLEDRIKILEQNIINNINK